MRVPTGSYVLVADGRKRLLARNDGAADAPKLTIVQAAEQANPATRDQVTDRAGSAVSPTGGATMGGADAHDVEEERFAAETAALLGRAARDGEFETLIVVAAPATLGILRKHYDRALSDKIGGEIGKDMTGRPVSEIEAMLVRQQEA